MYSQLWLQLEKFGGSQVSKLNTILVMTSLAVAQLGISLEKLSTSLVAVLCSVSPECSRLSIQEVITSVGLIVTILLDFSL